MDSCGTSRIKLYRPPAYGYDAPAVLPFASRSDEKPPIAGAPRWSLVELGAPVFRCSEPPKAPTSVRGCASDDGGAASERGWRGAVFGFERFTLTPASRSIAINAWYS